MIIRSYAVELSLWFALAKIPWLEDTNACGEASSERMVICELG